MSGLRKKNLEFISARRRKKSKELTEFMIRAVLVLVPILLVSLMAAVYWNYSYEAKLAKDQIDEIRANLSGSEIDARQNRLKELEHHVDTLESFQGNLQEVHQILDDNARITGKVMELIWDVGQGKSAIGDILYTDGNLSFTAYTDEYREAAAYAKRLEAYEEFDQVVYDGFTGSYRDTASQAYQFHMTVKIKGRIIHEEID